MTREAMIETSNAAVATANEGLETLVKAYEAKREELYQACVAMLTAHYNAVKQMWETSNSWEERSLREVASDEDLDQPYQIPEVDWGFFHDKIFSTAEEKESIEEMCNYSEISATKIRAPFVDLTT